jgi:predicted RNase H-like HicB family nuclease
MQIDYTVQVWREDGQFIAHAMPLDVASSGPTVEAARNAVDEAVRLFLATAAGGKLAGTRAAPPFPAKRRLE